MDEYAHSLQKALSYNDQQAIEELLQSLLKYEEDGNSLDIEEDFLELFLECLATFETSGSFMTLAVDVTECFILGISQSLTHYMADVRLVSFLGQVLQQGSPCAQTGVLKVLLVMVTSEKFVREVLVRMNDKSMFLPIIEGTLNLLHKTDILDEDKGLSILSLLQHFVSLDFSFGRMLMQGEGHQILSQCLETYCSLEESSPARPVGVLHLFQTLTIDAETHGCMASSGVLDVMVMVLTRFSQNKEILQLCLRITHKLSTSSDTAKLVAGSALLEVLNVQVNQVFSNFDVKFLGEVGRIFSEYTNIFSGLALQLKEQLVRDLVSTIHNIMCQLRDQAAIQTQAQQALLVLLQGRLSLLNIVNESSFHIPLATVVLGNVLIHGKCAETFTSCCELLSLLCTSLEVREALGMRNTHIAIYSFLRDHTNHLLVSALGYKFLHRYCKSTPENLFKVVSFGFLNEVCSYLEEHPITDYSHSIQLFHHGLDLFKLAYTEFQEEFTNQDKYCVLIQNVLVDIYNVSESLTILCLECLGLLRSWIECQQEGTIIGLTLDCMHKYRGVTQVHHHSLRLLQLLSEFDLPHSVVQVCQQDLQTFKSDELITEDVLVLMYLMVKQGQPKADWIITAGMLPDLFTFAIASSNDTNNSLKQMAYALLYVMSNAPGSKEVMLQSVCKHGSVEAAACMLALGASPTNDFSEDSPLTLACRSGNLSLVHLILEHKITSLKTPLRVSLQEKHHKITGLLLKEIQQSGDKDLVRFSGLGLCDLHPEWFEPVLGGCEWSVGEEGLSGRWTGEDTAEDVKSTGARLEERQGKVEIIESDRVENTDVTSSETIHRAPSRPSRSLHHSLPRTDGKRVKVLKRSGGSLPRAGSTGILGHNVFRVEEYPSKARTNTVLHPSDPRLILRLHSGDVEKYIYPGESQRLSSRSDSFGRKIPGLSRRFHRRRDHSRGSHHSPYPESESDADVMGSPGTVSMEITTASDAGVSTVLSDTPGDPPADIPPGRPDFRELDLSENQIGDVTGLLHMTASARQTLSTIRKVLLASNVIREIPQGFLQLFSSLTSLVMHHNALDEFPVSVLQCAQLQFLDLSHNTLCDFTLEDTGRPPLCSLTDLNLSHNLLLNMPVSLLRGLPRLQALNLSSNQLEEVPLEELVLDSVECLDLSHNNLHSVRPEFCRQLFSLKTLLLQGNSLVELPCSETGSTLDKLEHLDLSNNLALCRGKDDVPDFVLALPRLKVLNLSMTGLTSFCPPQRLKSAALTQLYLAHNRIRKFHIGSHHSVYANLQKLDLSHNELLQLPPEIGLLSQLASLDLSHNKRLGSLPDEMGRLTGLWELKLEGLKLDLDNSVLKGRTRDLIGYLSERYKKSVEYNQLKLMLVGYGGRGKTSLVQALMKEGKTRPLPTVGINVKDWRLREFREGRIMTFTLSVWDFAGQEDFYCTHQCFMSDRALYLVVYNLSQPVESELRGIRPWLQNIHARAPDCPVIVVGTHYDKLPAQASRDDTVQEIRARISEMCEQPGYPEVVAMVEVSCVSHSPRIERLRVIIKDILSGHEINGKPIIGHKVPASYVKLQELLMRELSSIQQAFPIITHKRLKQIVQRGELTLDAEELQQAVRFLHHSGVILHYEDSTLKLNDFYFLSPQWLCRMMAQVVTVREINPCVSSQGVLRRCDLPLLFSGKKVASETREYVFPPSLIPQYLRLLYKFDIALPLNDSELLIPARLPARSVFAIPSGDMELVRRVYTLEYVPAGLWSRLITRLLVFRTAMFGGEDVDRTTRYWTEGVFVQSPVDSVFYLVESRPPTSIQISVPPSPRGARLLGDVVYHLDLLIEEWYPGLLMVTLQGKKLLKVNIPCILCTTDVPFSFPLDYIIKLSEQSETIRCPNHDDAIPIKVLAPDVLMADLDQTFHLDQSQLTLDESPDQLLGHGTFGIVYRATYRHKPVAVKKYLTSGDIPAYKSLRQEALILSKLVHPSLIQLVAVDSRQKLLLLEFAPYGSLRSHLSRDEKLSAAIRHRVALQVSEGLSHLHDKQIIYRDLKPDNILVFSLHTDTTCNVKISDYGVAHLTTQTGLLSQEGTPGYRAAEVVRGETYSTKADMFSYGVTLYELITCGVHPFDDQSCDGFSYKLDAAISAGVRPQSLASQGCSWVAMQEVIDRCLATIPDDRPQATEVVSLLSSAESLCKLQTLSLCKDMSVDLLLTMRESSSPLEKHALAACGSGDFSQLTSLRLAPHTHVQGSLFTGGRVLCMLYISSNILLLGTVAGVVYSVVPESFLMREPECVLTNSVLCMAYIKGEDADSTVLVGTADGHVTLIPASFFREGGNMHVVDIKLGTPSEPVTCMCRVSKQDLYVAVATRLCRFKLKPTIVPQMEYTCNLWESDSPGPISHMVRHKTHLHVIKKWGHRLYKVGVRSTPYVKKKLDTIKIMQRSGVSVAGTFEARLLSLILVDKSTLWLTTANGCLLTVNTDTYTPLTCLHSQGAELRHMLWLPHSELGNSVLMSAVDSSSRNSDDPSADRFCELMVWSADLPTQTQSYREYSQRRAALLA